jgi:DNA-binding CsgD family transcriptional regulator
VWKPLHDRWHFTQVLQFGRYHHRDSQIGSPLPVGQFAGETYVSRFWQLDPIFKALNGRTFKISFHRAKSAGSFGASDIDNIAGAAKVLTALLARHEASAIFTVRKNSRVIYFDALLSAAPSLSEREASVCTGIILGMTSEGIALDLGISVNTVRTYRKRAYARLMISSQNELMKLILC